MNKILSLLILFLNCSYFLQAQSLAPSVIGSAGASDILTDKSNISWTIGEAVIFTGGNITQGFQQPRNNCPTPNTSLTVVNSEVCEGNSGTILILSSEPGVTYSIRSATGALIASGDGNGEKVTLTVGADLLKSGNNSYSIKASNSCGTVDLANIGNILVDAKPPIANAGPDQNICNATFTSLAANYAANGVGIWSIISGTGAVGIADSNASTVSRLEVGVLSLKWTISNGVCPSTSDTVNIIDWAPVEADPGRPQEICSNSATLNGNTPEIGTGVWKLGKGTSGKILNPEDPNTQVTDLTRNATSTLTWTITNGACKSSASVQIAVTGDLTGANAGPDTNICSNSIQLYANAPLVKGEIGEWEVLSGNGSVKNINSYNSGAVDLSVGLNELQWTISNGKCSSSAIVKINVSEGVTQSVVSGDTAICGSIAIINGNTPDDNEIGRWRIFKDNNGTATFADSTSPNTTLTFTSGTKVTALWIISNGACKPSVAGITITRSALLSASAGADQNICTDKATLKAAVPAAGKGTWVVDNTEVTIEDNSSATTQVSNLPEGNTTLHWIVSNPGCRDAIDEIVISVSDGVTPSYAGEDTAICAGTTSINLYATVPNGTEIGKWEILNANSKVVDIKRPNDPLTLISGLPYGITGLTWTISNGSCKPSVDTIYIRRYLPAIPALAGPDQTICDNTATLQGNDVPLNMVGTWTVLDGNESVKLDNPNNPKTKVTGLTATTYFRWTISNGACSSTDDDVIIHISTGTDTAHAGTDQEVCANTAKLDAVKPGSGTGRWSSTNTTVKFENPDSANTNVKGLKTGDNILKWTVSLGSCKPSSATVKINVSGKLSGANAGNDTSVCSKTSTTVNADPLLGTEQGTWSLSQDSPNTANITDIHKASTTITGLENGKVILTWSIIDPSTNPNCAASTDNIVIIIGSAPEEVFAGDDQDICGDVASLSANPTFGADTGTWTSSPAGAVFEDKNLYNTTVSGLSAGINILTWSVKNSACAAVPDKVNIKATPKLGTMDNLYANDSTICAGGRVALFAKPGFATYKWYWNGDSDPTETSSNIYITDASGEYSVEGFTSNGCYGISDSLEIDLYDSNAPSTPDIILTGTTVCDTLPVTLTADFNESITYQWFVDGLSIVKATNYKYNPVIAGNYLVMVQRFACSNISDTLRVKNKNFTSPSIITQTGNPPVLHASLNTSYPGGKYQWYAGKRLIVGATSANYTPLYNAAYYVSVKYNSHCFVMSAPYTLSNSDFADIERANVEMTDSTIAILSPFAGEMFVSPNPTEGHFTVNYKSETNNDISIDMYNSIGVPVDSRFFRKETNIVQEEFDGSGLAAGVYLLRIKDGTRQVTSKIVIH